jgi:hypothetical protein
VGVADLLGGEPPELADVANDPEFRRLGAAS